MSTAQLTALGFLLTWSASSVGLGIVMHRRGYSGWGWAVIGAVLGPVGIVLAAFFHVAPQRDRWDVAGLPGSGAVDVLVGTDGSAASIAAATAAVDLLGQRLGRVTIAAVEPFDATVEDDEHARRGLSATRAAVADRMRDLPAQPGAVVLHGRPADALRAHALEGSYELIVIGSHGHGASRAVLGSVAASLMDRAPVPLIVSGRGAANGRVHAGAAASTEPASP